MENEANSKIKVLSGLAWRFAERCGAQGVSFIVSIVLARILSPSDYGLIGLITVFISIATVFAQSGLGQALVQRKNIDNTEFSTVFHFSLVFSIVLYVILFLCSPIIAHFYNEPLLINIIRVLGLTVIIGAVNSVQQAYVQKTMQFKRFFYSTLIGTIVSAIVGIIMAYTGFGVWALVGQQISNQVVNTIVLWFTVKWRPAFVFSINRAKRLFSFGWKLLCSSLIDTIYNNIYSLIIGKFYSAADLGYYNRGKQFPVLIVTNINDSISSVVYPMMAKLQDESDYLKRFVRRSIVTSTFLIFPAMAGLAAIAQPLVRLILTDKWLPAVPFIYFCCFTYAFWPVHTANLQAIKALGRSDIFLRLEIIKKVVGIIVLLITLPMGLIPMMWGTCFTTIIGSVLNASPNKKLLGYSYLEQIKDIAPSMALSLVMLAIILPVTMLNIPSILQIVIQIIVGVIVYFGLAKLFKLECFDYVLYTVKGFRKRKNETI